jgi:hypothetical protein
VRQIIQVSTLLEILVENEIEIRDGVAMITVSTLLEILGLVCSVVVGF